LDRTVGKLTTVLGGLGGSSQVEVLLATSKLEMRFFFARGTDVSSDG